MDSSTRLKIAIKMDTTGNNVTTATNPTTV